MAIAKQISVSVSHRLSAAKDARAKRTRQRVDAAFVQLLLRRPYGDIRVSDIVRKAGVGRATFYAHYSTKDDLLRAQFNRGVAAMFVASPNDPSLLDASRFFAHIAGALQSYRALMGPSAGTAPSVLRECFENRAREVLSLDLGPKAGLTQVALARFVASSLFTVTECWLESGSRETPEQVQALLAKLVSPGLRAARG